MPMLTDVLYQETALAPAFTMVRIAGGDFLMGSEDQEAYGDEKPVHPVNISSFYLGQYPVTQALWQAVMGENPSRFPGKNRPVESVTWDDCQVFCAKLSELTDQPYRLPSEAEWEYAARGGHLSHGFLYSGSNDLDEVGWYGQRGGFGTQPIGLKPPNELGLYDMSGNVYEWCEDDWHITYDGAPKNGRPWIDTPERAPYRVCRGGGWSDSARRCRVSYRNSHSPGNRSGILGLRLAR
ncbi:MAG: formylglycine-generating enzyme family protein [Bacteroidota bacterium]